MPRPGLRWGGARGRTDNVIEQRVLDQRGRLLVAALGFAGLPHPSYDCPLWALGPGWTPGPVSAGSRSAWPTRASTFQLTRYDERGWRATFYPTGMEHSPMSATGTGWEPTPWRATQRAAWEVLDRPAEPGTYSRRGDEQTGGPTR